MDHDEIPAFGAARRGFAAQRCGSVRDDLPRDEDRHQDGRDENHDARRCAYRQTDDDRADFLRKRGFSTAETAKILERVLNEEGRKPESVFDFVQGITAVARDKPHQDARLDMEGRAKKLLDRVG